MKKNTKLEISLAIFFLLISLAYFLFDAGSRLNETLYLLAPILFVFAGLCTTRLYGHGNNNGRALFFISLGAICWMIGELGWYVIKFFTEKSPFPSIFDFFFLLAYPLFFIAIYYGLAYVKGELKNIKKTLICSNIILFLFLTGIVSYWSIYRAYNPTLGKLANIFSISYGIGDLFLIVALLFAFALATVYGKGRFGKFWKIMSFGFFSFLIADILFAIFQVEYANDLKPFMYIDLFWIAGYLFFSYALLENAISINETREKVKGNIAVENSGFGADALGRTGTQNDDLELLVKERTRELEEKNLELEKFSALAVGRELKMAELKERIKELENKNKS